MKSSRRDNAWREELVHESIQLADENSLVKIVNATLIEAWEAKEFSLNRPQGAAHQHLSLPLKLN
jgi:hypothetical protein